MRAKSRPLDPRRKFRIPVLARSQDIVDIRNRNIHNQDVKVQSKAARRRGSKKKNNKN